MTREEAKKLIGFIPTSAYTEGVGYGAAVVPGFATRLREAFPGFNWRVILDRSGERSRWALTIDDDDPREHYFHLLGGKCRHCGKTARELGKDAERIQASQIEEEEERIRIQNPWRQ